MKTYEPGKSYVSKVGTGVFDGAETSAIVGFLRVGDSFLVVENIPPIPGLYADQLKILTKEGVLGFVQEIDLVPSKSWPYQ